MDISIMPSGGHNLPARFRPRPREYRVRAVSIAVISIVCGVIVWPALDQRERGAYGGGVTGPQGQIVISDRDRAAVRSDYYTEYNTGAEPPRLGKKGNGWSPPAR